MSEQAKKQMGDMIVAMTTFSGIAHILMQRWLLDHSNESDIDELMQALTRRLKGLEIEGLSYEQQAKLISRSMETGDKFFEDYRRKIKSKSSRTGTDRRDTPT